MWLRRGSAWAEGLCHGVTSLARVDSATGWRCVLVGVKMIWYNSVTQICFTDSFELHERKEEGRGLDGHWLMYSIK